MHRSAPCPRAMTSAPTPAREQLLYRVQRFRGGLVFKAHRLCESLNSGLKRNEEEDTGSDSASMLSTMSLTFPRYACCEIMLASPIRPPARRCSGFRVSGPGFRVWGSGFVLRDHACVADSSTWCLVLGTWRKVKDICKHPTANGAARSCLRRRFVRLVFKLVYRSRPTP